MFRQSLRLVRPATARLPLAQATVASRLAFGQMLSARLQSTLARPDIEKRVLSVFESYAQGSDKLTPTATFQDLGLDSLDAVELMVAVEEEFGIEIPDKESDEIHSVKDAIDYIAAQPAAR